MPEDLVKSLQGAADIQSLRGRTTDIDVTFRTPLVKQVLSAAVELFKWQRYRSTSQKIALHAMSTSLSTLSRNNLFSMLATSSGPGSGVLDALEGTDVAGSDFEAFDQDTENEIHGPDDSQADYDSDTGVRRAPPVQSSSSGSRSHHQQQQQQVPLAQQLHQPLTHHPHPHHHHRSSRSTSSSTHAAGQSGGGHSNSSSSRGNRMS
jgi:hypothetical protein